MKSALAWLIFAGALVQFALVALPPGNDDLVSIHSLALDLAHGQDSLLYPGRDFSRNDQWIAHHEANLRTFGDRGQPNWCFYPPLIPLLASPVAGASDEVWRLMWAAIQLGLVALFVLLVERLLKFEGLRPNRLMVFALVLGSYPVARSVELGQTSLLIACIVWGAIFFAQTRRPAVAVLLAGMAIFVKPFLAVIVAVDAARRRWIIIAGYAAVYIALFIVSIAAVGLYAHAEYGKLLSTLGRAQTAFYGNQSLLGGILRFAGDMPSPLEYGFLLDPTYAWLGKIIATAVIGIAGWAQLRGGATRPMLSYGLWFSAAALALPISWEHHLVFVIPVVAFLWMQPLNGSQRTWLVISTLLLEICPRPLYADSLPGRAAALLPMLGNLILYCQLIHLHLHSNLMITESPTTQEAHVGA